MAQIAQIVEMGCFLDSTLDFYLVLDLKQRILLKSNNFDKKFYTFHSIEELSSLVDMNTKKDFISNIESLKSNFKTQVLSKVNTTIYLNWTATVFEDQDYVFYKIQDITENVQKQNELNNTKELLNKALDYMPGPVYTKDRDGKFVFVNSVFCEVVDGKTDTYIGKSNHDIFIKELADELSKNDIDVIENNRSVHFQESVPHPDGSVRDYDTYKFPLLDAKGIPFAMTGISIDITEKLKIQKELEIEKAKSVQSSKLSTLGEMAAGIAHEINTPLSIIQGTSFKISRLMKKEKIDVEKILESSKSIDKTVKRISNIIKGLRNFARDGELVSDEVFNLSELIEEVLSFCKEKFTNNNIHINWNAKDHDVLVKFNRIQLSQVILNLLHNSSDAVSELEQKWIKITSSIENETLTLSITDSGTGIPFDIRDKIMQPFFTTKAIGAGTGIGLSISSGILQTCSCKLNIDTNSNNTKFDIILKNRICGKTNDLSEQYPFQKSDNHNINNLTQ
jgi:PAS domain S-box-containing protein